MPRVVPTQPRHKESQMLDLSWPQVLVVAFVAAVALFLIAKIFDVLRKLLKIWFVILVLLIIAKLISDAGWI